VVQGVPLAFIVGGLFRIASDLRAQASAWAPPVAALPGAGFGVAVTPRIWHRGANQGRRSAPVEAIMYVMVFFSMFAMAFGFVGAICWMASVAWRKIRPSEDE